MPPKRKTASKSAVNQAESSTISATPSQNINTPIAPNGEQNIQQPIDTSANIGDLNDDKKNKRRGRKPKDKFNIDDTFAEQNNSLLDFDNNIVIKLPIACKDLESELSLTASSVLYNPILSEPQAFNECSATSYGIIDTQEPTDNNNGNQVLANILAPSKPIQNTLQTDQLNPNMNNLHTGNRFDQQQTNYMDYYQNKINDLLCDLDDSASKKRLTQIEILLNKKYKTSKQIDLLHNLSISYNGTKWPQTSNICCFWCCHNFDNTPWGIPKSIMQKPVYLLCMVYFVLLIVS